MGKFSRGRYSLMISDRSGAAFPYREMVQEWTGAWVHNSEYEPKQPQIDPRPHGADAQALQHAKPARVEFAVEDLLPNNPFTTTAASQTLSVSFPSNDFNEGTTYVTFRDLKQPVGGVAITTLELTTTLNGAISDSATTVTLTDASEFPTSGYIMIRKILTSSDTSNPLLVGTYQNEVIEYTGKSTHDLTGCTRGSSAPYKGLTPPSTTAGSHSSGAKVFGSYLATAVGTSYKPVSPPGTETQYNSLTVQLVSNATSAATGGGFQCTIGPVNDRD
tara:strand:+ start:270 stop:1094 length:825 start_codon:yes stop_codon:yes gene_type:complete